MSYLPVPNKKLKLNCKKIAIQEMKMDYQLKTCDDCSNRVLNAVECGRCADGHGDCVPLCEDCCFPDAYYGSVCSECHGYILDNK